MSKAHSRTAYYVVDSALLSHRVRGPVDLSFTVDQATAKKIRTLLAAVSGPGARVFRLDDELSASEAARLLGISRPALDAKLDAGEIPFTADGSRRKISVRDFDAYTERIEQQKRAGMRLIAELGADDDS